MDYIVKLGGSLLYDIEKTKAILEQMYVHNKCNFAISIGSGILGEMYKGLVYDKLHLDIAWRDSVRDYANIQSINATVLASLCDKYYVCSSHDEVKYAFDKHLVPIIDARGFLDIYAGDMFQKSDVRAAYFCNLFQCDHLIIVTDVSGVYDKDPNNYPDARKYDEIDLATLEQIQGTVVDEGLAQKVLEYGLNCTIIGASELEAHCGQIDKEVLDTGTKILIR